jgi:hypothetical protein
MELRLTEAEIEGRLNCFGEFDAKDRICMVHCALSISCAIAKNRYFTLQHFEDSLSSFVQFDLE